MFSSTEEIGLRGWRAILSAVIIVALAGVAWSFRTIYNAPLGRTAPQVTVSLLQAMPPGTPYDSAAAWLQRHNVECCSVERNTLLARERDVAHDIIRTDMQIRARLDAQRRIVSWFVQPLYTGP